MPNWHFGANIIKFDRFYEEIDLKWHTFCEGTLQVSSIARQIYHLDSWNLIQNCPTASSNRNIHHCLTIISNIVFRILNVREGYPHPKIPNFDHCTEVAYGGQYLHFNFCITQIELKLNAKHIIQIHQWHVGVIGFTNVHLCISFQCTKQRQKCYVRFLQNTPIALLMIYLNKYCVHKLIKHSNPVLCCLTISSTDHSCCRIV